MENRQFRPIVITTTGDDRQLLESICQRLIREKLAACTQISGPITSCYRWQNEVESAEEWSCSIKTSQHLYSAVEQTIMDLHSYDQPEIIAVEICEGESGYLAWMAESLG